MLKNYFLIALRNMRRSKLYTLINTLGLSIGIACCLLLALYVQEELQVDRHHRRLDDLYRIVTHIKNDMATCSPPIAMTMAAEVPEVEVAVRVLNPPGVSQNLIRYEDNLFYESDGLMADSTLFNIFSYTFLEGNPAKALIEPNSIVLTEHLAKKLFGDEPALNKILYLDQGGAGDDFHVTAVIKDETRSHIHANFFVSMTSSGWGEYIRSDEANGEWAGQNFMPSYVRLVEGANLVEVTAKMNDVLQRHGAEDLKAMGLNKTLRLEPVKDIYLKSSVGQSPRIIYTYVIVSIAVFILLLACINFMNLSTAKAAKRAGEIGVRKVMGAFRSTLIKQLMGETLVIVVVSLLVSVIMVQLALPFFNELTGKHIAFGSSNMLYIGLALTAIAVITGVAAGSYPAFYISSFQPAQVLKGKFDQLKSSGWLRRGLVVFQFMIAIALVCGMLIISRQLTYIQEKNLGFEASAKIVLPLRTVEAHEKYEGLKRSLGDVYRVNSVSGANYIPGSFIFSDGLFFPDGSSMDNAVRTFRNYVDAGYMELLHIKLLAGRSFTDNREVEQNSKIIINRKAVEEFGFTLDNAVGQHIHTDWQGTRYTSEVVGVMEDFHQTTLKENILPMLLAVPENVTAYDYILIDVQPENFKNTIASLESKWKEQVNNTPFEYTFLDESISQQYNEDRKVSAIITTFTIIAMLISCLGLYGLSTYMAERRFKEIGVRKVLGASVPQIVGLMSKEFVVLVLIAFAVAVPLSLYAMTRWLEAFAYKAPIDVTVYLVAGGIALLIAILTVSVESIRAASGNPVVALRNE